MKLKNFEGYDIEHLLNMYLEICPIKNDFSMKDKIIGVFKLIAVIFCRRNKFLACKMGKDNKILMMTHENIVTRNDTKQMISNVLNTIPDMAFDKVSWMSCRKLSFDHALERVWLALVWYYQLRTLGLPSVYRMELVRQLLDLHYIGLDISRNLNIVKYKLAMVFYDAPIQFNFMMQFMRLHGCLTATMQHCVLLSRREEFSDIRDYRGIELGSFVSDYLLAWNDFTRQEALKMGIDNSRIIVLGNAKCMGMPAIKAQGVNVIGVILDGECNEECNIPMITAAQRYAEENGFKCVLRFHPGDDTSVYNSVINSKLTTICPNNVNLSDFFSSLSFGVAANSTVVLELEYFQIPFVRYTCGNMKDKFIDFRSAPSFTDDDSFVRAVGEMHATPMDTVKETDVDNYRNFFINIIKSPL